METRGSVNVYVCQKCKNCLPIILLASGVTPFMLTCTGCNGRTVSTLYQMCEEALDENHKLKIEYAFYRPSVYCIEKHVQRSIECWKRVPDAEEIQSIIQQTKEHCANGGLIAAPIGIALSESLAPFPNCEVDDLAQADSLSELRNYYIG